MIYRALADRGHVYRAQGRIFNNMLYVRYEHFTKAKSVHKRHAYRLVREMLQKDYDHKGSIINMKISDREPQGAWRQDELTGGKPPIAK
jgi:hypothetical protein